MFKSTVQCKTEPFNSQVFKHQLQFFSFSVFLFLLDINGISYSFKERLSYLHILNSNSCSAFLFCDCVFLYGVP
jgi:hypothetical protein